MWRIYRWLLLRKKGVTKYDPYGGLSATKRGWGINPALNTQIDNRNASHFAIVADAHLDYAVKAALCDGNGAAWTAAEQAAARSRMGIDAAIDAKLGVIENGTY